MTIKELFREAYKRYEQKCKEEEERIDNMPIIERIKMIVNAIEIGALK